MRIRPFGYRILVDPDELPGSVLARPDTVPEERAESGVIIAVGSQLATDPVLGPLFQPGVRVAFHPRQVHVHRARGSSRDIVTLSPGQVDCIIEDDGLRVLDYDSAGIVKDATGMRT